MNTDPLWVHMDVITTLNTVICVISLLYFSLCHHLGVETRLGLLGYPGHVWSESSGYDPVYKISGSDLDSALDHMR